MSENVKIITADEESSSVNAEAVTFEVQEGAQFVVNEETGEVQVIDLGDPSISQEVEVVTVEAPSVSSRLLQNVHKMSSNKSDSASLSNQNINQRIKSGPALLRNSRRFQAPEILSSPGTGTGETNLRGRSSITPGASQLPPASANYVNKSARQSTPSTTSQSTSTVLHSTVVSQPQPNIQSLLQHAVLLDENGQPTDEYVVLEPTESGEYSIVDRGRTRDQTIQPQFIEATDIEKMDTSSISIQHQGQTIYICQDPNSEVSHVYEDEDGNLIPVDTSNLEYQMEDATIFELEEGSGFDPTEGIMLTDPLRLPKQKRKPKKPLQVIIGPDGQPVKKKGQTELKCLEKGCIMTCFNVSELRKHLHSTHSMLFDEEIINFSDEKEFKLWRETYERERMVSFIYRGGTKKIAKDQAVTYMICHRSGHYKPTMVNQSQRKRKMKPQGSCKMGGYCTAGIKLLKNLDNGGIKMDICHTHYGHPLDSDAIPHLRVNPTLRKTILGKFRQGLSFTEVLAYIHHNPDRLEGLRLVDRRAVRNIFDTWKHPTRRSKQAQKDIDELATDPEIENIPSTSTTIKQDITEESKEPDPEEILPPQLDDDSENENCSSQDLQGIPSLLPVVDGNNSNITESVEDEDSGPPKLVLAVESQKRTRGRKKRPPTPELEEEEEDPCILVENIKTEPGTEIVVTRGTYGLRPNRKVEVYNKPNKTKKSRMTPEPETSPIETKKPNTRKSKRSISIEKEQTTSPSKAAIKKSKPVTPVAQPPEEPPPIIVSELLEQAIEKLINHGESGPTVLLYKPIGNALKCGDSKLSKKDFSLKKEEFCVVLQTPVQRQLLQMFPNVIGFEILDGPKSCESQLKLAFLIVLDEYREAIPVAWMVANSVDSRIIGRFFKVIRNECGELKTKYLISPRNSNVHKLWCSTFEEQPSSVQNDIEVRRDLKSMVWQEFTTDKGRREIWEVLESMLIDRDPNNLTLKCLKEKFEPLLDKLPHTGEFLERLEEDWLSKADEWAMYTRFGTSVNIMCVSNSFGKLRKFVSFKGTKNLNDSFEHILKIGYDKCFLRSKRMFKGDQKHSQFLEAIKARHAISRAMFPTTFENINEDTWKVCVSEDESYTVSFVNSPCTCKLLCKQCKICIHLYTCSCKDYLASQIMCEHVHFTHCKRNNIVDEPEIVSGNDVSVDDQFNAGVFGKFETNGVGENPGQMINIDAVLKAAGLFHRSDGLQPDQIVSITDADTQRIIYEHNPSEKPPEENSPETII